MEKSHSMGGTNTFMALFAHIYIIAVGNILSQSCTKSVTKHTPMYKKGTKRNKNRPMENFAPGTTSATR